MDSVVRKSLNTMWLEACREIAGNEQIDIQFSRKDIMLEYDPDKVQDYFTSTSSTN